MRPLIAANWKMNKTVNEALDFVNSLNKRLPNIGEAKEVDIAICPSFVTLLSVAHALKGTNVALGAQDIFYEEYGAYTGEISPGMLKEVGCSYVVVGHSERREYFFETDFMINRKVKACLRHRMTPILCVGEAQNEREEGEHLKVVKRQLTDDFEGIAKEHALNIVVAYEPIWAIGTGITATPEQAQEMHAYIRQILAEKYGDKVAQGMRIIYGGSVKPDNIKDLMAQKDINGALLGGASLDVSSFIEIVKLGR